MDGVSPWIIRLRQGTGQMERVRDSGKERRNREKLGGGGMCSRRKRKGKGGNEGRKERAGGKGDKEVGSGREVGRRWRPTSPVIPRFLHPGLPLKDYI